MNFGPGRSGRRSASDLDPDHQRAIAALGERLRERPARGLRERQLERIVAEARSAAAGPRSAWLPGLSPKRLRAAIATGVIVIGLPATAAGLATAGVTLPDPAVSAFEAIGVTLPNQASGDDDQDRSARPGDRNGADGNERDRDRVGIPGARPTRDRGAGLSPQAPPAGAPEGTPSGPPDETPSGAPDGTPSGPPAETPSGPPDETPSGAPEGTPSGPPAGAPSGPPEGAPNDPPEGTPSGSSAGIPGGVPEGIPSGGSADAQRE